MSQKETPLPRQWSATHRFQTLSLSNNSLRVTYKGPGKNHKDAASVRTDFPIPATCGIYYFEIKIISKGRDGYMGIGLSKADVHLNRLPGWDKNSYGYHGDDGHSFCCSGTGQNYGPTFTTGDVIGCCVNLIENTCFYTKNGYNLGVAFRDLPGDLYPTVGLQTPSESVEANFGHNPFEFDIHEYVKEWHLKTRATIERFPMKKDTSMPTVLRKLISTYLAHHGYSATAEAFAKSVGHIFEEELASIRNRQRIQKALLNGCIGEAVELTRQLFPGILEKNPNLLFALKIRQFIEMVNGIEGELGLKANNKSRQSSLSRSNSPLRSQNGNSNHSTNANGNINNNAEQSMRSTIIDSAATMDVDSGLVMSSFDASSNQANDNASFALLSESNGVAKNGNGKYNDKDDTTMEMDSTDTHQPQRPLINTLQNDEHLQKILKFGRELFQLSISPEHCENPHNQKLIRDAFSLLAYHEPWSSPVGYQLDASQREPISALLNIAILEANNMPRIPPLEVVYGQTSECMKLMLKNGVPWCAYVNLTDYMQS